MKSHSLVKAFVVWLACVGLLLPRAAPAADPEQPVAPQNRPAPRFRDVALGPHGTLRGTVVNPQGEALAGARIVALDVRGPVAESMANADGRFAVANLPPGPYVVLGGQGAAGIRAWTPEVAPPAASHEVLIVSDGTVLRGQNGLYQWISEHYFLTAALVATAIAVPVTLGANYGEDRPASP